MKHIVNLTLLLLSIVLLSGCAESSPEEDLRDFITPNLNSRVELKRYEIIENIDLYHSDNIRAAYKDLEFEEKGPVRSLFYTFDGDSSKIVVFTHSHNYPPSKGLLFTIKEDSIRVKLTPSFTGDEAHELDIPRMLKRRYDINENVSIQLEKDALKLSSNIDGDSVFVWFTKESGLEFIFTVSELKLFGFAK